MNEAIEQLGLQILEFRSEPDLRTWLEANHSASPGIWVRLYKTGGVVESITFEHVLDQGLCFGWSESQRLAYDRQSYLQKFTPRKTRGTTSARNLAHARALVATGQMTDAGLHALKL